MDKGEVFVTALLTTAFSIVVTILLAIWGVPSFEQVTSGALVTVRDQAAKTGIYDASFNPGFQVAIMALVLAGYIATIYTLLERIK